jgi:hypothetical protein
LFRLGEIVGRGDEVGVSFEMGARRVKARVIEDRGTIGVGGRRLLRVRVGTPENGRELELPAEEVVLGS